MLALLGGVQTPHARGWGWGLPPPLVPMYGVCYSFLLRSKRREELSTQNMLQGSYSHLSLMSYFLLLLELNPNEIWL
jgi:hypothetical protein